MAQNTLDTPARSAPGKQRQPFPTLNHVWIVAALALVAMRPLVLPIAPHDFWWHLATGRVIVQTGSIPVVDSFSYTQAGEPFLNQGWLAQVLLYGLHSLGGVPLILLVQAAVITLAYGLLLWLCMRRSGTVRLSVGVLLLAVLLTFDNWHVRPQTYALPLFAAYLVVLYRWREAMRLPLPKNADPPNTRRLLLHHRLWVLPLLMLLWVNLHGTFVLGGALMALSFGGLWLERRIQSRLQRRQPDTPPAALPPLWPLFVWGIVTALAMLANPRGIGVIGYVLGLLRTSAVTTLVEEWQAVTVRTGTGAVFVLFLLLCVLVLVYARQRPDPQDMLLAVPFVWLALGAERNIIWFVLLIAPVLALQLAPWFRPTPDQAASRKAAGVPFVNGLLIALLLLLLLLALPWLKPHLGLPPQLGSLVAPETPVQAVGVMQQQPPAERPQRLYHAMSYGSYLIWAAPEQPVFIDPRIELYPFAQWQDYVRLNAGINSDRLLARYRIDGLLLSNEEQAGLLAAVSDDGAWRVVYRDTYTTYLVRDG